MSEVAFDMIRSSLQCLHERPGFLCQVLLVPGRKTGAYPLLQIPVQVFIRVMFRHIWWQIENLNPLLMLIKPLLYHLAVMHPKIIQNQKDLPFHILDQPGHEPDQHRPSHGFSIQHEANLALIGDRRNHVDVALFGIEPNNRRLPFWGKAAGVIRLVIHSRFVSPVNFCLLLLRSGCDLRVSLLKPLLQLCRVLLIGPLRWLLGGSLR